MLKAILTDSLVLFLLVYALLDIFTRIAKCIFKRIFPQKGTEGYHVLYLKSGAQEVERAVREELRRELQPRSGILLVDMNLSHEERRIAEKLCEQYSCLTLLRREEFLRLVERQMTTPGQQN